MKNRQRDVSEIWRLRFLFFRYLHEVFALQVSTIVMAGAGRALQRTCQEKTRNFVVCNIGKYLDDGTIYDSRWRTWSSKPGNRAILDTVPVLLSARSMFG